MGRLWGRSGDVSKKTPFAAELDLGDRSGSLQSVKVKGVMTAKNILSACQAKGLIRVCDHNSYADDSCWSSGVALHFLEGRVLTYFYGVTFFWRLQFCARARQGHASGAFRPSSSSTKKTNPRLIYISGTAGTQKAEMRKFLLLNFHHFCHFCQVWGGL